MSNKTTSKQKLEDAGFKLISSNDSKFNDKVELFIKADFNDEDYLTSKNDLKVDEFLELLPTLRKIKNYEGEHNWEDCSTYLSDNEIDYVNEYVPHNGDYQIHTIVEMKATFYSKEDQTIYELKI